MKKIELVRTKTYNAFEVRDVVEQEIKEDEVEIEVNYAGLAFADVMMRMGKYPGSPKLPFTPGYDVTGKVTKVGSEVKNCKVGDKVTALPQFGGYTQKLVVNEDRVFTIAANFDPKKSVCLMLNYTSAYQMLVHEAKVKKGQVILVHSGAGGVGTALLDLARVFELKTYATASLSKHDVVKKFGAIAIDYKANDFVDIVLKHEPNKVDFVFDPVGGSHWKKSRKVLKKGGVLVGFGMLSMFSGNKILDSFLNIFKTIFSLKIFTKGKKFKFYGVNFNKNIIGFRADVANVLKLYAEKKIDPHIGKVLPLVDIVKAHQLLSQGKTTGKVILNCKEL